jgi:serpin B
MCKKPAFDERLFIDQIMHKAMMAVDENGVEAAAATAVIMAGETAIPADPVPMVVNKPFVVAIVDEPTGALLFLGHIDDPTARAANAGP